MKNEIPKESSRRKFLRQSATALSGFIIVPRHVLGGVGYVAPSDMVNVGVVGVGGRGRKNVLELLKLKDTRITAIADPAEYWDLSNFYYQSKAGRAPVKALIEEHYQNESADFKVKEYEDFRIMLEKEQNLDAVLCATPDHLHAYVILNSMKAGKHVYCEKPLTHNLWEAREVQKLTTETGLATQMGNQLHSTPSIRNAVEYLRAGIIGYVREVHTWVPASRWLNALEGLPTGISFVPKNLNWDLWIGPRAKRPFHEDYAPVTWRDFWEFGCGALGDFGCHDMDAATWGLDLPAPDTVEVLPAGFSNEQITPYGEIGYYQFPAKGDQPSVDLKWYSGGLRPPKHDLLPKDFKYSGRGALYIGDKGIMVTGGSPIPSLFPLTLAENLKLPSPSIAPTEGHHQDWINAIKGGPTPSSNFEYATRLTEITLLGVLSLRMGGQKIFWNSDLLQANGLPEADKFIRESEREGWEM